MIAQPPNYANSPDSPTDEWKCTGITTKRHPEAINRQFKCKYCDRTYKDYLKENPIAIGQRILLSSSGIAAIVALCLGISAFVYAWQKFAEADRTIIQLNETKAKLSQVKVDLKTAKVELEEAQKELKRVPELEKSLKETQNKLELTTTRLQETQSNLEQTNKTLTQTKDKLQLTNQQVAKGSQCVKLIGEINDVIWHGPRLNPDAVMRIQQQLKSLGFYQGETDGTFAEITIKAVNDFQQDCQAKLRKRG